VNVEEIIDNAWDVYRFLNNSEKISLKKEIIMNAPLNTDRRRLETIFNNLISNAIKYSDTDKPDPCVTVKITTDKEEVSIIVEDNGLGIDQEQLEKVFMIFYRGHNTSHGSGLGLYIVKEIVEKLEGNLKTISKPGVGTSFVIKIPNNLSPENTSEGHKEMPEQ
jgi:signal transduction histidine kinase